MRHKKRSPTVITVRFQSTHPLRDATCGVSEATVSRWISIHAPLTGCDVINIIEININIISIHAPLTGCDCNIISNDRNIKDFNPRTPYGMRPWTAWAPRRWITYFNPRTPYGMRLPQITFVHKPCKISIHAPLTGCDGIRLLPTNIPSISIHAPLTGCDTSLCVLILMHHQFQSTHPLRDAT